MAMAPIGQRDLDEVLAATAGLWEEMRGQRLFLTGGTGFFGCWLVESFLDANRRLGLGATVTVLTRDPEGFAAKMPHLAGDAALELVRGDVRDFDFPAGVFRYVIHAATEASAKQLAEAPEEMRETIVAGTRRVLEFAAGAGTKKFLFTSSGAVYGVQPLGMSHVGEEFEGAPTTAYGEGKRAAEAMCVEAAQGGMEVKIARCFAFVGPHLPLDTHFAVGNFLRDALAGRAIEIAGDGTAVRSYLYAGDLAVWLWTILFRGASGRAYNVGSEAAVSIRELAEVVSAVVGRGVEVRVAKAAEAGVAAQRYVPSTARARGELGVAEAIPLAEGLRRTAEWHRVDWGGSQ